MSVPREKSSTDDQNNEKRQWREAMYDDFAEQRKHFRVYFNGEDEFSCLLKSRSNVSCQAKILDLSLGGVHLALAEHTPMAKGDLVTITACHYLDTPASEQQLTLEVRWVLSSEDMEHMYLGCQFRDLSLQMHDYFAEIISQKIKDKQLAHAL